jgi:hypothetical protein
LGRDRVVRGGRSADKLGRKTFERWLVWLLT